jgi:hypothetical protein
MAATALIASLCYMNSLEGQMVFDDKPAILSNNDVAKKTSISEVFLNDFWGARLASYHSHKSYRPITVLSFRLNVHLLESMSPWGFHFGNLLLHAATSALLIPVYLPILDNDLLASVAAACYFAAHPVHTDAVASIVGRADVLCGFFVLLAMISYNWSSRAVVDSSGASSTSWLWLLLSLAFAVLAMLSKEQGVTVLALCVAFDLLFTYRLDFKLLLFSSPKDENKGEGKGDKGGAKGDKGGAKTTAHSLIGLFPGLSTNGGTIQAQLRLMGMRLCVMAGAMVVFVWGRLGELSTVSYTLSSFWPFPLPFHGTFRRTNSNWNLLLPPSTERHFERPHLYKAR